MNRRISRYGWIPDLPDQRDHLYAAPVEMVGALPPKVDLRAQCPRIYNQGQLGSCTANAIAGAIEFDRLKQKIADFTPSRLFIYYNERAMEHSVDSDSGAQIRDGIKSVGKLGDCPEAEWPYEISQFKIKPTKNCYADALKYKAILYQRVMQTPSQLKGCLASGYPFVFGFTVYESFEGAQVAKTGHASLPKSGEPAIGGHAVVGVGYDDAKQRFIVRNSWGDGWGMKGYFTLPYAYVMNNNLADDFWTIRVVQ
jgi:C1A family cysteine protease